MKASKIGLLILVLGFGGVVETAWGVRQNIGFGPQGCRVLAGRFFGPSYTFDAEQIQPVPAGTAIEVVNARLKLVWCGPPASSRSPRPSRAKLP